MMANKQKINFIILGTCTVLITACAKTYNPLDDYKEVTPATAMSAPEPGPASLEATNGERLQHGRYLVELLGCANCHTDGALIGEAKPSMKLAGSRVGIAYTNPLENEHPGVVFPSNLTPDPETGIGAWSDIEVMKMIRSGIDRHGRRKLSVMPWPAYSIISDDDALSIVMYLRSLEPIRHQVPASVTAGDKSPAPYVHFGTYQSRR